jgi:restriction system protein
MSIPDYQAIMLPLLELASDGKVHQFRAAVDILAHEFQLTDDEKRELLPSGRQPRFQNRVGWARTYMAKAQLLESPMRGTFCITERGQEVLSQNHSSITSKFLERFPEFIAFRSTPYGNSSSSVKTGLDAGPQADTPEENLEAAYHDSGRSCYAAIRKS